MDEAASLPIGAGTRDPKSAADFGLVLSRRHQKDIIQSGEREKSTYLWMSRNFADLLFAVSELAFRSVSAASLLFPAPAQLGLV